MSVVLALLTQILHTGLMIVAAPAIAGAMGWFDARLLGQPGPPIVQPWRDLMHLSRKTPVTQESVSSVSRLAPAIGLGAMLAAAALVPSFTLGMALSPLSDVLVIVSLLTVARVATALVALDSGAAVPGLAAQASAARAILAEPALMMAVFTLAPLGGSFNLDMILGQQHEGMLLPTAASTVALCALLLLVFADATGVDRGLDQMLSGTDLAIARMTGWLRRLIWIDLIGGVFIPVGMAAADSFPLGWLIGLTFWAAKLAAFMLMLCFGRAMLGQIPRKRLQEIIGIAALLALLATIMVLAATVLV
jgi:formate hydrogenlyase subunit 4